MTTRYGKDRFEVLLLSVDMGWGEDAATARKNVRAALAKANVSFTTVIDPKGWDGVMGKFNIGGYDPFFVDPKGIVRGYSVRANEVESLLKQYAPPKR